MSVILSEVLNISRGEGVFKKDDFTIYLQNITLPLVDDSLNNLDKLIDSKSDSDKELIIKEMKDLISGAKFVYAELLIKSSQEFKKTLEETPIKEKKHEDFLNLLRESKRLKLKIIDYCNIKNVSVDNIEKLILKYENELPKNVVIFEKEENVEQCKVCKNCTIF